MKNKTKQIGKITIIVIIVIIVVIIACIFSIVTGYNPPLSGSRSVEYSARESKNNGMFISEFDVPKKQIILSGEDTLYIEEAWLSQLWIYGNFTNMISIDSLFLLNIKFAYKNGDTIPDDQFRWYSLNMKCYNDAVVSKKIKNSICVPLGDSGLVSIAEYKFEFDSIKIIINKITKLNDTLRREDSVTTFKLIK